MSHAFEPTRAEIGYFDPLADMMRAHERRKRMYAQPKPKPAPKPVVIEAPRPAPKPEYKAPVTPIFTEARMWDIIDQCGIADAAVAEVTSQRTENRPNALKILDCLKFVAREYGISITALKSERRPQSITLPRQIFMYYAKEYTGKSLPMIGRECGGRDHTTALHAVRKIARLIEAGEFVPAKENDIRASLGLPLVEQPESESSRVQSAGDVG